MSTQTTTSKNTPLPLTVQEYIKRLDTLVGELKALPTNKQDLERTVKAMPDNLAARYLLNSKDNMTLYMKVMVGSSLRMRVKQTLTELAPDTEYSKDLKGSESAEQLLTRLRALRTELENGTFNNAHDLAHAEIYGDLLADAEYLLSTKRTSSAALKAGMAGEAHLRQLAKKNSGLVSLTTQKGGPKSAGALNDDLKGAGIYGDVEHKQQVLWQEIRNSFAHPKPDEKPPTPQNVEDMIKGLRQFVAENPA